MKKFTKTEFVIIMQLIFGLLFLVYAIIPGEYNHLNHFFYAIGFFILAGFTYYRSTLNNKDE
jgi:uncharacterized membrane protein